MFIISPSLPKEKKCVFFPKIVEFVYVFVFFFLNHRSLNGSREFVSNKSQFVFRYFIYIEFYCVCYMNDKVVLTFPYNRQWFLFHFFFFLFSFLRIKYYIFLFCFSKKINCTLVRSFRTQHFCLFVWFLTEYLWKRCFFFGLTYMYLQNKFENKIYEKLEDKKKIK